MTVPTGIRGNEGLIAKFGVDPDPAVDYGGDVKSMSIASEDKDDSDLTFEEAASGETKNYQLVVKALQATAAGSLWRLLWDSPGATFAVTYGPHGNAVPSADKPHFLMTVKANGRPVIGGDAKRSKERYEWDYTFEVLTGPTIDDGAA